MTDNELLSQIADSCNQIADALAPNYSAITSASALVTHASPLTRAANPGAVKTLVVNQGPNKVRVYEGGALVDIVPINDSWASPTSGKLAISVQTDSAETADATITTYT